MPQQRVFGLYSLPHALRLRSLESTVSDLFIQLQQKTAEVNTNHLLLNIGVE